MLQLGYGHKKLTGKGVTDPPHCVTVTHALLQRHYQAAQREMPTFSVICPLCAICRTRFSTPLAFSCFTRAILATAHAENDIRSE